MEVRSQELGAQLRFRRDPLPWPSSPGTPPAPRCPAPCSGQAGRPRLRPGNVPWHIFSAITPRALDPCPHHLPASQTLTYSPAPLDSDPHPRVGSGAGHPFYWGRLPGRKRGEPGLRLSMPVGQVSSDGLHPPSACHWPEWGAVAWLLENRERSKVIKSGKPNQPCPSHASCQRGNEASV